MKTAEKNIVRWLTLGFLAVNIVLFGTTTDAAVQLKNPVSINITNNQDEADLQTTWDCIWFGHYPQSSSSTNEPIKWRVLSVSGNEAFLVSDIILDCRRYNQKRDVITWETCDLRSWLNNDFLNKAFNESEKAAIKTVRIANKNNPKYTEWSGGNDTEDKVFLLSYDELTNKSYGFPEDPAIQSLTRTAKPSAYTSSFRGMIRETTGYGQWWMRTIGYNPNYACHIYWEGWVFSYGWYVDSDCYGVRPALYLNLSSSAWSYAGTVCSDGTVKGPEEAKEPDAKDSGKDGEATSNDSSSESSEPESATCKVGAFSYMLDNNTATVAAPKTKTAKTITIPATVKIKGKSVPVTGIAPNAFKGMKNLTSVTIGKNIKKIGKNAFNGCKKLKKITVKTTKLTKNSVGANAFKGINKKAVIKCPKAKKKAYKKIMLKKGMKKTMTFK